LGRTFRTEFHRTSPGGQRRHFWAFSYFPVVFRPSPLNLGSFPTIETRDISDPSPRRFSTSKLTYPIEVHHSLKRHKTKVFFSLHQDPAKSCSHPVTQSTSGKGAMPPPLRHSNRSSDSHFGFQPGGCRSILTFLKVRLGGTQNGFYLLQNILNLSKT
jgi:hypothetical protein